MSTSLLFILLGASFINAAVSGNIRSQEEKVSRATDTELDTSVMRLRTPIWLIHPNDKVERITEPMIEMALKLYENTTLWNTLPWIKDANQHWSLFNSHDLEDVQLSNFLNVTSTENGTAGGTAYPEILLVLDHNILYTTVFESRFFSMIMYVMNFWNSVNLRLKSLENPRIRLRIAGIVVNTRRTAASFVKNHLNAAGELNGIEVEVSLGSWVQSHINVSWDVAVLQTNARLQHYQGFPMVLFWRMLCNEMERRTGVFQDTMDYSRILQAARLIAKKVGGDTDEYSEVYRPEGGCSGRDGYMLSRLNIEKDEFLEHPTEFSSCTKDSISRHFRSGALDCMKNPTPSEDEGELMKVVTLPGQRIGAARQCQMRDYASLCESSDICRSLQCRHTFWFCVNSGPALDGTPCPGGGCQNGRCVGKDK